MTRVLLRGNLDTDDTGKTMWGHRERTAIYKPWKEALEETHLPPLRLHHSDF